MRKQEVKMAEDYGQDDFGRERECVPIEEDEYEKESDL